MNQVRAECDVFGAQPLVHSAANPAVLYQPYAYEYSGQRVVGELGRFQVSERYDHPDGLKNTSPTPGPPIVYLAGGPGGSAIHLAKGVLCGNPNVLQARQIRSITAATNPRMPVGLLNQEANNCRAGKRIGLRECSAASVSFEFGGGSAVQSE